MPDCRAYELVTPPYKEGAVLLDEPAAIAEDGAAVIDGAGGAFAGAGNEWWNGNRNPEFDTYEFTRTGSGWQPTALTPPATQYPHSAVMAASGESVSTTLWGLATTNLLREGTLLFNEDIYLRNGAGQFLPVGPGVGPEVAGEGVTETNEELDFAGASSDLKVMVFSVESYGHGNLWPGDTTNGANGGAQSLYQYTYTGAPSSEPTLVGVDNEGPLKSDAEARLISNCGTNLGSPGGSSYNAVSETGETVFFTVVGHSASSFCAPSVRAPEVSELFARVGGVETVPISEPSKLDCEACDTTTGLKDATFAGASQNGGKVFFLTEQKLLPGQEGMNLYEYDFHGPLASGEHPRGKISAVSDGAAVPEVQGVVRISEDGSHVYFVAKGVLAGENAEKHQPEAGADNLYLYDTMTGKTVFVAKLLTHGEEAAIRSEEQKEEGEVKELAEKAARTAFEEALVRGATREEAGVIFNEVEGNQKRALRGTLGPSGTLAEDRTTWSMADNRPAQATPDGEFLVFLSSEDLTQGDESKGVPQLFEYDAGSEALTRVSIGQSGAYNHDGAVDTFRAAPQLPVQAFERLDLPTSAGFKLALSDDGSKVFFTSAASLTPEATPGITSVYEYSHGNVYLISDGKDASVAEHSPTVQLLGTDPAGTDVFFLSADALVPQDEGETQMALYDAREEGGFPAPAPTPACTGESCRGASGAAPRLQLPQTVNQPGGDNLPPPVGPKPAAKPAPKPLTRTEKLARALKACKSKHNKRKRASCKAQARKAYAAKMNATKSTSRTR